MEKVECRSEIEYAGRPTAFYWQGERRVVQQVLASWRAPEGKVFRVSTVDQQAFELVYLEADQEWEIRPV